MWHSGLLAWVFLAVSAGNFAAGAGQLRPPGSLRASPLEGSLRAAPLEDDAGSNRIDRLEEVVLDLVRQSPVQPVELQFLAGEALTREEQSPNSPPLLWAIFVGGIGSLVMSCLLWTCLVGVIAHFYRGNKEYPEIEEGLQTPEQHATFQDWKFGFCDCFEEFQVCFCACCCPAIRWAETLSLVDGLIVFWVGFALYMSLTLINTITSVLVCWFVLALICTAYRQELRTKFSFEHQGGATFLTDLLLHCFCTCCAIAQEARHVEEAMRYGHPQVKKPCKQ